VSGLICPMIQPGSHLLRMAFPRCVKQAGRLTSAITFISTWRKSSTGTPRLRKSRGGSGLICS
jgi:hypothetical protein